MHTKELLEHAFNSGRISTNTTFQQWHDTFLGELSHTEFKTAKEVLKKYPTLKNPNVLKAMEEYAAQFSGRFQIKTANDIFEEFVTNGVKSTLRKNVINAMQIYASQFNLNIKHISDKEIEKKSLDEEGWDAQIGFEHGAKWMREQLKST